MIVTPRCSWVTLHSSIDFDSYFIWVVVPNIFHFHPHLGFRFPVWLIIFQMGWFNHQLSSCLADLMWEVMSPSRIRTFSRLLHSCLLNVTCQRFTLPTNSRPQRSKWTPCISFLSPSLIFFGSVVLYCWWFRTRAITSWGLAVSMIFERGLFFFA